MYIAVTAALLELPAAARPGHRVCNACSRDGVHERRLPCACQKMEKSYLIMVMWDIVDKVVS